MLVPCTDLKGPHTLVSNVRGRTFTCFGNVVLACHNDCPSVFPVQSSDINIFLHHFESCRWYCFSCLITWWSDEEIPKIMEILDVPLWLAAVFIFAVHHDPLQLLYSRKKTLCKGLSSQQMLSCIEEHGGTALSFCSAWLWLCLFPAIPKYSYCKYSTDQIVLIAWKEIAMRSLCPLCKTIATTSTFKSVNYSNNLSNFKTISHKF